VRDRIDVLEAKTGDLKKRVNRLNRAITELQIEINRLDSRIARVSSEVRVEQELIDETEARIERVEDLAKKQAVTLYKTGGVGTVKALLDSATLAELNDRIEMLGVAARQNTGALIRFHRLRLAIEDRQRVLFAKRREIARIRDSQSEQLAARDELRADLSATLTELQGRLGKRRQRERILEEDVARLEGTIRELQARREVEALGESAQGFIWPLNGRVTSGYGPRWGRMHTGIDISGYRGQPVVASKGGRVIMASSYSGYGNTVIVDHGGGVATLYAHLSGFDVSNGQNIDQGKIVGYVGCTGSCTGDHLHFEVRVNGSPRNPLDYLP
jgi:murein DD-endopeptidase MepM/ murein hydrolase activator NlpD